jgi:hypothetical protein
MRAKNKNNNNNNKAIIRADRAALAAKHTNVVVEKSILLQLHFDFQQN